MQYIDKLDDARKKKLEDMLDAARKGHAPAAAPPGHRTQATMSQVSMRILPREESPSGFLYLSVVLSTRRRIPAKLA